MSTPKFRGGYLPDGTTVTYNARAYVKEWRRIGRVVCAAVQAVETEPGVRWQPSAYEPGMTIVAMRGREMLPGGLSIPGKVLLAIDALAKRGEPTDAR